MPSRRASTACRAAVRAAASRVRAVSGQGTLEYAVVAFAFLAVFGGLGSLWHLLDDAVLVRHALQSASHHIASAAPGAFADAFMY